MVAKRPDVIIMGGSLGGLTAALVLRDAGCDVQVYERSHRPLVGQGAGIVLNPATVRYFTEKKALDIADISIASHWVRYLDQQGNIADEKPYLYRFSSYNALYRGLLSCFATDRYHLGEEIISFAQDNDRVHVQLASGGSEQCDLLVCADGIRSTGLKLLLPAVSPAYAGYIAWRGTIGEGELQPHTFATLCEAITYYLLPKGHVLIYPIPVVDAAHGTTRTYINWLWYRNVPQGPELDSLRTDKEGVLREVSLYPGTVQERFIAQLREDAVSSLPQSLAEVVCRTVQPFLQLIVDRDVTRMAFERVCLIGDAAFVARPHAAAGTAKAAEDAWKLGEAVKKADGDVVNALNSWEPAQLQLGRAVLARTREAGRRLQFEGTWRIGEPLPFGLHKTGDSTMPDIF